MTFRQFDSKSEHHIFFVLQEEGTIATSIKSIEVKEQI